MTKTKSFTIDGSIMQGCDRCGRENCALIMSMYNEDMICTVCKEDEEKLSSYEIARRAELAASGNPTFQGAGLTVTDRDELARMRRERHEAEPGALAEDCRGLAADEVQPCQ